MNPDNEDEFLAELLAETPRQITGTLRTNGTHTIDDCQCPECGSPMVLRSNRYNGQTFAGCSTYPSCRGTRQIRDGQVVNEEAEDRPVLRSTRLTVEELEQRVAELEEKMAEVLHYYQGEAA